LASLPRKYSLQFGAFLIDGGRLFHACAEATAEAFATFSVEHLVDGSPAKTKSH